MPYPPFQQLLFFVLLTVAVVVKSQQETLFFFQLQSPLSGTNCSQYIHSGSPLTITINVNATVEALRNNVPTPFAALTVPFFLSRASPPFSVVRKSTSSGAYAVYPPTAVTQHQTGQADGMITLQLSFVLSASLGVDWTTNRFASLIIHAEIVMKLFLLNC